MSRVAELSTPPRSRVKRFKHAVLRLVLRAVSALVQLAPITWGLAAGGTLGRLVYRIDRRRARRARTQLRAALSLTPTEADRMAAASYAHLGRLVVEVMRLPVAPAELESWVELPEAAQTILQSAADEARGVVFATGHIGNWELLAQRIMAAGFDGVTVVRRLGNAGLQRWVERMRTASGVELIERGKADAPRRVKAALRRGALLGLLVDQRTTLPSVDVPFFGRHAPTSVSAAALALRGQRPVVVATIRRRPDGRHTIEVVRIPLPSTTMGAAERRRKLTSDITLELERAIRRAPEQWVWLHDRWSDGVAAADTPDG